MLATMRDWHNLQCLISRHFRWLSWDKIFDNATTFHGRRVHACICDQEINVIMLPISFRYLEGETQYTKLVFGYCLMDYTITDYKSSYEILLFILSV